MKQLLSLLFGVFVLTQLQAQTNSVDTVTAKKNLLVTAQKMAHLFTERNYTAYAKAVHPKLIKLMGGQEKFIVVLSDGMKQMEDQGYHLDNITIGDPLSIIVTEKELQSVVPQILQLKVSSGGRLVSTSYLVAVSSDKGKTWYLIDTAGKTLQQMQSAFPLLSNKLIIPEKSKPVFYND